MSKTKKAAWAALVIALALTLAGEVAAQSGPAPGYDDPYAYAVDHAQAEADAASGDPAGWAGGKATLEGVEDEATHAGWLACWVADHEADANPAGVCDAYYVPAEAAAPEQPAQAADPAVADPVDDRLDDAEATLAEVVGAAGGVVEDPLSAPEQVQRIVTPVVGFVDRTASWLVAFVEEIVELAAETLGVGGGLVAAGTAAAGEGILDAAVGSADGALHAAALGGEAVETAAAGIGDGAADASRAVEDVAADATRGVSDAVASLVDVVAGWFGGGGDSRTSRPDVPVDAPDVGDGLDLPPLRDVVDGLL